MKQSGAGKEVHKGKVTSSESDNSTLLRLLTFVIHAKIIEGLDRDQIDLRIRNRQEGAA